MLFRCVIVLGFMLLMGFKSIGQTNVPKNGEPKPKAVQENLKPKSDKTYNKPVFDPANRPIERDSIIRMKVRAERGDDRDYELYRASMLNWEKSGKSLRK